MGTKSERGCTGFHCCVKSLEAGNSSTSATAKTNKSESTPTVEHEERMHFVRGLTYEGATPIGLPVKEQFMISGNSKFVEMS